MRLEGKNEMFTVYLYVSDSNVLFVLDPFH